VSALTPIKTGDLTHDAKGDVDAPPVLLPFSGCYWKDPAHVEPYRHLCEFTLSAQHFIRAVHLNIPSSPRSPRCDFRRPDRPGFPRDYGAYLALDRASELWTKLRGGAIANGCGDPPASTGFTALDDLFRRMMSRWGWSHLDGLSNTPGDKDESAMQIEQNEAGDRPGLDLGSQLIFPSTLDRLDAAFALLKEACLAARSAFGAWPKERDGVGPGWPEWDSLPDYPAHHIVTNLPTGCVYVTRLDGFGEDVIDLGRCRRYVLCCKGYLQNTAGDIGPSAERLVYYLTADGRWIESQRCRDTLGRWWIRIYQEVRPTRAAHDFWHLVFSLPPELEPHREAATCLSYKTWLWDRAAKAPAGSVGANGTDGYPLVPPSVSGAPAVVNGERTPKRGAGPGSQASPDRDPAEELRSQGLAIPAALVEFMRDRKSAPFDVIKDRVHGNADITDGAVRVRVSETSRALMGLGFKLQFRTSSGYVFKDDPPE
jgi:hypothetical protein